MPKGHGKGVRAVIHSRHGMIDHESYCMRIVSSHWRQTLNRLVIDSRNMTQVTRQVQDELQLTSSPVQELLGSNESELNLTTKLHNIVSNKENIPILLRNYTMNGTNTKDDTQYDIGDQVLLKRDKNQTKVKISDLISGPYTIIKVYENDTVMIGCGIATARVSIRRIKPYTIDD